MTQGQAAILVVEDDATLSFGLTHALNQEGHNVECFDNGEDAIAAITQALPDLVILDIMLPGMSGLSVLKYLKARDPKLPVLLLTARQEEIDRVEGLDLGADDYITKPFSVRVLLAKVRAWLRRTHTGETSVTFGKNTVDLRTRVVTRGSEENRLTTHEAAVLSYLIENRGRAVTREELLQEVWGYSPNMQTRTVDNQILKLRKKLETDHSKPLHILTIHGKGYRFEA